MFCEGDGALTSRYRFISAERATYGVTRLCRVLRVRRQGFYEWLDAAQAREQREQAEDALAAEITAIHAAHKQAYGSPRVTVELRRRGRRVNRKKVERIMRQRGIVSFTRRRRRSLTRQDVIAPPAPDLLGRDFTAAAPGEKLVGDITYLPTEEGWLYLATVIDLHTREVVGHAMAEHTRAELACDAIALAAGRGLTGKGAIFHSDRGSQGGFNRSSQHEVVGAIVGVRRGLRLVSSSREFSAVGG
ncbi:IS3 family transposase [Micromonospora globispora]|nr:IS3 family transposase [Micromonospora globispora]